MTAEIFSTIRLTIICVCTIIVAHYLNNAVEGLERIKLEVTRNTCYEATKNNECANINGGEK